jgi:hypothetical protein
VPSSRLNLSAPVSVCAGAYYEVRLKTRKTAQTGVLHTWTLHANDADPVICPVRGLIRLAMIYGREVTPSGPLFLQVHSTGAILSDLPMVSPLLLPLAPPLLTHPADEQHHKPVSEPGSPSTWIQVVVALRHAFLPPRGLPASHQG